VSDLANFRDHAREMADGNRPRMPLTPSCKPYGLGWKPRHDRCDNQGCGCDCHPWNAPIPEAERRLWASMRAEIDAYLASTPADDQLPFGGDT